MNNLSELPRGTDGSLPAYAWPGSYPIVYLTADYGELCPDCANGRNGSLASEANDDPQWQLTAYDIHYEGAPITCAHCDAEIEAAYGDPHWPGL